MKLPFSRTLKVLSCLLLASSIFFFSCSKKDNPITPTYTVKFNTNGGSTINDTIITSGGKITKPADPTKAGFTFDGWDSYAGLTKPFDFNSVITSNTIIYAKWKIITYTVQFNTNGGSTISNAEINSGEKIPRPTTDPTKKDSILENWYSDIALTKIFDFNSATTSNLSLYAKWTKIHTITFNTNGGSTIKDTTIASGGKLIKPNDPTKTDSILENWYSDAGLTIAFDFNSIIKSNIILYAKWKIKTFTVKFNSNAGSIIEDIVVDKGATAIEPSEPTKTDFIFENWYSDAGLTTAFDFTKSIITSDITLYANWVSATTPHFTVKFNSNGGSLVNDVLVVSGWHSVVKPNNPTKTDSTLENWYSDASLTTIFDFNSFITRDTTLYAKWKTITYTVSFNTNEGTAIGDISVSSGGKVSTPTAPTKPNYSFGGWYSDAGLNTAFDFSNAIIRSNTIIYAKWTIITYTVSFNTNDGSTINEATVNSGERAIKPTTDPTKADFIFENWYSDAALTTVFDFTKSIITSDITLYANWVSATTPHFTVKFNSNGGSSVNDVLVVSGGHSVVKPNSPTKTDSTLENWYSDAGLTTLFDFNSFITRDTTLYAKWKTITYTVSFNTDGGTPIVDISVSSGATVSTPTAPTKANYSFVGWYSDANLTTAFDFGNAIIRSNTIIYAKWTTITYTVSFNTDGGTAIGDISVSSGATVSTPTAAPTRTNYSFVGWYSDAALNTAFDFNSVITSDITLYAKWVSVSCDITSLTITANNIDYVATFSANTITVTFYSGVAVPANANIKILTISDKATASVSANGTLTITNNAAVITVTAEDGITKKDWAINFVSTLASTTGKAMIPDVNFRSKLKIAVPDAFDDKDSMLTTHSSVTGLEGLDISVSSISNLAGIEFFTSLSLLYGFSNSLTSLDLSKNTALTKLSCSSNSLTFLDIRGMRSVLNLTITSNGTNSGLTDLKVHTSIKDHAGVKAVKTALGSAVKISTWDADAGSTVYTSVCGDYDPNAGKCN